MNNNLSQKLDLASIKKTYDRYINLSWYDQIFGKSLQHGRIVLAQSLVTQPGHRLLELGVGSGLMLPLYPRDIDIIGVDVSELSIFESQRKITAYGLTNIQLKLSDAENTDFPTGSFDHVVLPYIYSVTPNPLQLIEEAKRLCKFDGNIYIINHFSGVGSGVWKILEYLSKPFARYLGFRSDFPFQTYIVDQNWNIQQMKSVNWFGLSRMIHIKNT